MQGHFQVLYDAAFSVFYEKPTLLFRNAPVAEKAPTGSKDKVARARFASPAVFSISLHWSCGQLLSGLE